MAIVGGLDVHRKQLTFDYLETDTGRLERGRITRNDHPKGDRDRPGVVAHVRGQLRQRGDGP